MKDPMKLRGVFTVECYDKYGVLKWSHKFPNTVTTAAKNLMFDTVLAGSGYTVTGPYMGLITTTSFTAVSAADTMTSHAGWLEAGGANAPTYSGNRPTISWNAASGGIKTVSAQVQFTIGTGGVLKGAFIVLGSGASATKDDTGGVLWSAGQFSFGTVAVNASDVVKVSYTVSA